MGRVIEDPKLREKIHVFRDRSHAGRMLAEFIREHAQLEDVILFAIPAGGIPVAYEISKILNIPMDLLIVRKIQVPWDPEAGFGAITWDGEAILNQELVEYLGLTSEMIEKAVEKTMEVVQARVRKFRGDKPMPDVRGRVAIIVDDGLATGYTMLAAIKSLRKRNPKKIMVAVPTASINAVELVSKEADEILCLNIRSGPIYAVADAYREWRDLTDEEVMEILEEIRKSRKR